MLATLCLAISLRFHSPQRPADVWQNSTRRLTAFLYISRPVMYTTNFANAVHVPPKLQEEVIIACIRDVDM